VTDEDERLRLDYDQTTDLLRTLTDVRFKLLALVPTIAGAAVGVLGHSGSAAERLAVGLLGLMATLGILLYELRNTQIYDYALHRAKELEARLGLVSIFHSSTAGGLYTERPGRSVRLFGITAAAHDRGLALVYGAALGGWSYLVAWGGLRELGVGRAKEAGAAIGVFVGLVVVGEVLRIDVRPGKAGGSAEPPRELLQPGIGGHE
jgi:hypothetical protein